LAAIKKMGLCADVTDLPLRLKYA